MGAITPVYMDDYDATATTSGEPTHKAWVKYLHSNYKKLVISDVLGDIDAALAVENRTDKPVVTTDNPTSRRIDAIPSMLNLTIPDPSFLQTDTAVVGANVIVGIDRRYAMRRVVNVSAAYDAVEQYVMRRASAFRMDSGQVLTKLYPDAWTKLILTARP